MSDSMPSTAMPSASLASMSATPGSSTASAAGPRPDGVGEQQLAAGRRPQTVLGDLEAALVGDLEPADLLDGVAPELHPDGVLLGGREDVEDAAAHGELAPALDEVGARVGGGGQGLDDVLQRRLVAGLAGPPATARRARARWAAGRRGPGPRRPTAARTPGRSGRGGPAAGGRRGGGPRCRCGGSAARAAASPSWGTWRPRRPAAGRSGPRPGRRPHGSWR